MARTLRTRSVTLVATFGLVAVAAISATSLTPAASATPVSLVRIDQVGYLPSDAKHAYLMASSRVDRATWDVTTSAGVVVAKGQVSTTNRGPWNANYRKVYDIDFSSLTKPGTYRLHVHGEVTSVSPSFSIESANSLYGKLVNDGVSFYQVQRDGPDQVPGPLNRQPSHLGDARATVYSDPDFVDQTNDDSLVPLSPLTPVAGAPKVDVSGGWFDAGDSLKFTQTASFGDVLLYASQRALGNSAPSTLKTEAAYGGSWLDKMWNMSTKTLYNQVGVGTGNGSDTVKQTFNGDHDLWRLPQADTTDAKPIDIYATTNRPVFEAAPPGQPISPNLAGRTAAAFALAAQVDAKTNPDKAEYEYTEATTLYAQANTTNPPNPLVTAEPWAYYPETSWHDDMELGAAEIALAAQKLHHNATPYLQDGATWAKAYLDSDALGKTGGIDTFNLYDVSVLAHTDLATALATAGNPTEVVTRADLVNDVKRQLLLGVTHADADPFRAAGDVTNFDVDSHTFDWIATEAWYVQLTGDHTYDAFAAEQRDWLLGANAWGTSFMVGEGSTFPDCIQHQIANLSGNLEGNGPKIDVGAVVNGPNNVDNFEGGLGALQKGMRQCPVDGIDPYVSFNTTHSAFSDDVRSWQTDEPALDMTGAAIIASATQLSLHAELQH